MIVLTKEDIKNQINNLLIYLVHAFFVTILYFICKKPTQSFLNTIEESISIYSFSFLYFASFLIIIVNFLYQTQKKTTKMDEPASSTESNSCYYRIISAIPRATIRAAINFGLIIVGSLLGIAMGSHLAFLIPLTKTAIYITFYGYTILFAYMVYLLMYFSLIKIYQNKIAFRIFSTIPVLMLLFIIIMIIYFKITYKPLDYLIIGVSIFTFALILYSKFQKK